MYYIYRIQLLVLPAVSGWLASSGGRLVMPRALRLLSTRRIYRVSTGDVKTWFE